jgi:hypothetical protein
MALIIDKSDFVGEYQFQFQNNLSYWTNFIEIHEEIELRKLFGDVVFAKLKLNPNDVDFNPILATYYQFGIEGRGLKSCIIAFVYCKLINHNGVYSPQGVAKIRTEVGSAVYAQENYSRAYNEGVYDAHAIRHQLKQGLTGLKDYSFNGDYKLTQFLW